MKKNWYIKAVKAIAGLGLSVLFFATVFVNTALAYVNTWGYVKEGGANIRASASTESEKVASVASGAKVEICGKEDGADGYTWYKVYVNGTKTGYIRGDLIEDSGEETGGKHTTSVDPEKDAAAGVVAPTADDEEDVLSSDATIHSLSLSDGVIEPEFTPENTNYIISVGEDTTVISAFGVPNTEEGAKILENAGFSDLQPGENSALITVQAADGSTMTYNFCVIRGDVYQDPVTEMPEEPEVPAPVKDTDENSHTGIIVFLVILVVIMGAAIAYLLIRNIDYRARIYGTRPSGIHLPDFGALGSKFSGGKKSKGAVKKTVNTFSIASLSGKKKSSEPEDEDEDEEEVYDEEVMDEDRSYAENEEGDSSKIHDPGMRYSSIAEAVNAAMKENEKNSSANDEGDFDDDEEDSLPVSDTPDYDEDEIEDILERNDTILDNEGNKEVWKSVNFMNPRDDLEFEFLDMEDEDDAKG